MSPKPERRGTLRSVSYAFEGSLPIANVKDSVEGGATSPSDRSTDEFTWTEEEETAVRRKLDRVIVPLTTFLYLLCFLDRYVRIDIRHPYVLTFKVRTSEMHVSRVWQPT